MSEMELKICTELLKGLERQLRDSVSENERLNGRIKGLEIAIYDTKDALKNMRKLNPVEVR